MILILNLKYFKYHFMRKITIFFSHKYIIYYIYYIYIIYYYLLLAINIYL